MREIITGTDKQLYDMIIKFHDLVFEEKAKDFLIKIYLTKGANLNLLNDFVSLVNDIQNDWHGEITVNFQIEDKFDEE